jgi:hypothetical protein
VVSQVSGFINLGMQTEICPYQTVLYNDTEALGKQPSQVIFLTTEQQKEFGAFRLKTKYTECSSQVCSGIYAKQ